MKIFISQPMRGKTTEEIVKTRDYAINECISLFNDSIEIVDTIFDSAPEDSSSLWFLGESIKKLGEADIVYFCKDWEKYNGCTIEHECAVRYGKEIVYA